MNRISSNKTNFIKKVLPFVLFGGIALISTIAVVLAGSDMTYFIIVLPVVMILCVIGVGVFKMTLFHTMDAVFETADAVRFVFEEEDLEVSKSEIERASLSSVFGLRLVTVYLKTKSALGKDIRFIPSQKMVLFKLHGKVNVFLDNVNAGQR